MARSGAWYIPWYTPGARTPMRPAPLLSSLLTCLALGTTLVAQGPAFTVAEGASPTTLEVRTFTESAPTGAGTLVLKDAEFLPLEITNRGITHDLRQDKARLVVKDGLTRVELPGNGRLLRYRLRGGDRYGFLLILADGTARVVLELAGVGATGKDDPFEDRFGVGPDGAHAAFLTLTGALWIARLDGQNYASTGQPARPVAGGNGAALFSLCVGKNVLFFQTNAGIKRCPLADNGVPVDVSPVPLPQVVKEPMAPSGDGTSVVFLAGANRNAMQMWRVGETGTSTVLAPAPTKLEEPTYLPENPEGSRLVLSEDGTRLLYSDVSSRDEIFLIDVSAATTPVAVTSDSNFQPYIGTIILPVFSANIVTVAVGDPGKLDVYTATTGQALVNNATQTAGNTVRPWGVGALLPNAAFLGAGGQVHVLDTDANNVTTLRTIQPSSATSQVQASGLTSAPVLGAAWTDAADVLVPTANGDRLHDGIGFAPLLAGPTGITLSPSAHAPGSAYTALRASVPGVAYALVLIVPGLGFLGLPPEASARPFAITSTGSLLMDTAAGIVFASTAGVVTLPNPGAVRALLSGAGA